MSPGTFAPLRAVCSTSWRPVPPATGSRLMHPMLNIAVKAARRAGQIINRASLDLDLIEI
ncbi:inositol monophosphatase, partial [Burkholderia sp. SIMBA_048]